MFLNVGINGLNKDQCRKMIAFFDTINMAASQGNSRVICLGVDGDGDFRPSIQYSAEESNRAFHRRSHGLYDIEALEWLKTGKDILFDDETVYLRKNEKWEEITG
jgi:hypothetical protein